MWQIMTLNQLYQNFNGRRLHFESIQPVVLTYNITALHLSKRCHVTSGTATSEIQSNSPNYPKPKTKYPHQQTYRYSESESEPGSDCSENDGSASKLDHRLTLLKA